MSSPHVILVGADKGGVGKSQPLTSRVLTPYGWRLMGDMRVGHPIVGVDGKTYRVSGIFPQWKQRKFVVSFTDGTKAECSPDHLWTVRHVTNGHREGWVTKTAEQLQKSSLRAADYFYYRIPHTEAVEFVQTERGAVDPYVLGVLIGDGALTGHTVVFSAPEAKAPVREKVAANVAGDFALKECASGQDDGVCPRFAINRIDRNGATMLSHIRSLGLDVKSKDRFIPDLYKTASYADRLELLRGLMDTDGSSSAGRTSFSTCSSRLADDVSDLVRSLGGIAIVNSYDRSHEGKSREFDVNVRMNECPFSLDYKIAAWKPAGQFKGKYIASIEEDGSAEMQCIMTTAPDHLYVTDGYNATHNTTVSRTLVDYLHAAGLTFEAFDTETPVGVLKRFHPDKTAILDITKPDDQVKIFDTIRTRQATLIDIRAGVLTGTSDTLNEIGFLDGVAEGRMRLSLLHVIGSNQASIDEIRAIKAKVAGAKHYLVVNRINDAKFEGLTDDLKRQADGVIEIGQLNASANGEIDQLGVGFSAYIGNLERSETLRGYTRSWLKRVFAQYDAIGLKA